MRSIGCVPQETAARARSDLVLGRVMPVMWPRLVVRAGALMKVLQVSKSTCTKVLLGWTGGSWQQLQRRLWQQK